MLDETERGFLERIASLEACIAVAKAQVLADPIPHLRQMIDRCNLMMRVLEDVDYALSPDSVFDYWEQSADKITKPQDINGEAYLRCSRAKKVLREYRAGRYKQDFLRNQTSGGRQ